MSFNNETLSVNITSTASTIIIVLDLVFQRFVSKLPLIITILGIIGFIGNSVTFLQPTLRQNTCCIYTLCGSFVDLINLFINLFPRYTNPTAGNLNVIPNRLLCKLKVFVLLCLPQLSMDLLIMSLIDRYACTCDLTSPMRYLLQLKMVPWLIAITVVITCLISIYSLILNDFIPGLGCIATRPTVVSILYTIVQGILTPGLMLILVFLIYRKFKQNRQRVTVVTVTNAHRFRNQLLVMVFAQALVTCVLALQWIIMYWYYLATQYDNKTAEGWAITSFAFSLTNNLYYLINVRSFYLSTLTSHLFRETLIKALLKLLPRRLYYQWYIRNHNVSSVIGTGIKREERPQHQL